MDFNKTYKGFKDATETLVKRYANKRYYNELLFAIDVLVVLRGDNAELLDKDNFIVQKLNAKKYIIKSYNKFFMDKITNPETGNTFFKDKQDIVLTNLDTDALYSLRELVMSIIDVTEESIELLKEEIEDWESEFDFFYTKVLEPVHKQQVIDAIKESGVDAVMVKPSVVKETVK